MDWGDPDLWFAGLGSAIVTAIAAVVTAFVIANHTSRLAVRQERKASARVIVAEFVRTTFALMADDARAGDNPWIDQEGLLRLSHWNAELLIVAQAVRPVDAALSKDLVDVRVKVQDLLDVLAAGLHLRKVRGSEFAEAEADRMGQVKGEAYWEAQLLRSRLVAWLYEMD